MSAPFQCLRGTAQERSTLLYLIGAPSTEDTPRPINPFCRAIHMGGIAMVSPADLSTSPGCKITAPISTLAHHFCLGPLYLGASQGAPITLLLFDSTHVCLRYLTPANRLSYTPPAPSRLAMWIGSHDTAYSVVTEDLRLRGREHSTPAQRRCPRATRGVTLVKPLRVSPPIAEVRLRPSSLAI